MWIFTCFVAVGGGNTVDHFAFVLRAFSAVHQIIRVLAVIMTGAVDVGADIVVASLDLATVRVDPTLLYFTFVLETKTLSILALLDVAVGLAAGMTDAIGFVAFVRDFVAEFVRVAVFG
jgi:hypothetical protein